MLEEILAPVKAVDEIVHRAYAKPVVAYEANGGSKYTLAMMANASLFMSDIGYLAATSIFPYRPASTHQFQDLFGSAVPFVMKGYVGLALIDIVHTYYKKRTISEDGTSGAVAIDLIESGVQHVFRSTRLGVLGCGVYATLKGIHNAFDPTYKSVWDSIDFLWLGGLFSLTASSMYIKDSDQKVLDKKPMWKSAWEKVVGFYESVKPQPVMVPIPVHKRDSEC